MVVIMAMLIFNQSANIHSHQLADGSVVTHAHPYQKTSDNAPEESHHHNLKEFVFFDHLSLLFTVIAVLVAALLFTFQEKYLSLITSHIRRSDVRLIFGRDPPFYSISFI